MNSLIDTHCHLTWNVDDGIESKEMAEHALAQASNDGIHELIATPHFVPGQYDTTTIQNIKERMQELQELAKAYEIKVHTGAELFLNSSYLDMIDDGNCPSLADSHYLLCEFDVRKELSSRSEEVEEKLYEIKIRGYIPVIAHVERYFHNKLDIKRIQEWSNQGCVIQVNRTSLLGLHGETCEENAKILLEHNMVHLIASDAHRDHGSRICKLSDAYAYIEKHYGREAAEILCKKNPQHIILDEPLQTTNIQKQSFFQRLFGRS